MKKLMAALLAVTMILGASALAATYNKHDIAFNYDDKFFTIDSEEHNDAQDIDIVALKDKNGNNIVINVRELKGGEAFPTLDYFKDLEQETGAKAEKLETWANFKNVLHLGYTLDSFYYDEFVAPVCDDDDPNDIEAVLDVTISGNQVKGEAAAMESSDKIAEVVDSLKVDD
jgi:hypothetical protein